MNFYQKRLLYIHNQPFSLKEHGGLNTTLLQVFSMCNAFQKKGLDVVLYMENSPNFHENLENFQRHGFSEKMLFNVKTWQKKSNKRLLNRFLLPGVIKKIIKTENPDLIFTREAAFLNTIVRSRKKVIYESHNALQHKRFKIIHTYLEREIIKASKHDNFQCLFSISEALLNYWKTHNVDENKLHAWHDGFDEMLFKSEKSKEQARQELNLPNNKQIVTYTGGLYADREIENIIRLAQSFPDQYFLIIGGPEKNKQYYEQMAKDQKVGNIHFLGFRDHAIIPAYLYASDVLLALWSSKVPTINYCSPLKLFEYMAAGRVLLAHAFPTIKEVLEDKKDAIFCEPENFTSMKQGLQIALDASTDNRMGLNAREKAFNMYSWDTRVEKLLDFLKDQ